MLEDILNPRRAQRFAVRCAVEIRHRQSVWNGETEDVSPTGCQVVTPRVIDPGRDVRLAIRCDVLAHTVLAAGRVIWMRANAPARLGIEFSPAPIPMDWVGRLARVGPGLVRPATGVPDRLPREQRVYLGKPPAVVVDFTLAELDVLRRIGSGVTLDALARSFGPEMNERVRGALFALIARRCLALDRRDATDLAAWKHVLAARDSDLPAAPEVTQRALNAGRPPEAQRLYDEALAHIGGGRLGLAMDRLRDALKHAPGDTTIASTAKRIGRWAL